MNKTYIERYGDAEITASKISQKTDKSSTNTSDSSDIFYCIEKGMKPVTLAKILGHSSIRTTLDIYTHVSDEQKIAVVVYPMTAYSLAIFFIILLFPLPGPPLST